MIEVHRIHTIYKKDSTGVATAHQIPKESNESHRSVSTTPGGESTLRVKINPTGGRFL
jgi:hypothetical protein